jgi:hypothetical protein
VLGHRVDPPSRLRPPGTVLVGAQEIFTIVNPYRKYVLQEGADNILGVPNRERRCR